MMRDMPKGLPQAGDRGLDNTDTWGRKYWGGAMFCLLADIEIRKATGNKLGLQDAMRGVIAAGGNHEKDWPIERVLATADKAVGVDVMTRLHSEMGPKPVTPDLAALWRDLGLRPRGEASNSTTPRRWPRSARRSRRRRQNRFPDRYSSQRRMLFSTSSLIDLVWMARNSGRAVLVSFGLHAKLDDLAHGGIAQQFVGNLHGDFHRRLRGALVTLDLALDSSCCRSDRRASPTLFGAVGGRAADLADLLCAASISPIGHSMASSQTSVCWSC